MFDLDGTLVDSVADLAAAANRMLGALGLAGRDPALLATFVGKGIPKLVERTLVGSLDGTPDAGLMARALPLFEDYYWEESGKRSTVYPGVTEGLSMLAAQHVPLACVTNKSERFTHALLKDMRLDGYFSVVVGGDTLAQRKPHPAPIRYACERLAFGAAQVLMVGDSRNDVAAARAACCPVVCVPYGYNEGEPVASLDCDAIVPTVEDAARLVIQSQGVGQERRHHE